MFGDAEYNSVYRRRITNDNSTERIIWGSANLDDMDMFGGLMMRRFPLLMIGGAVVVIGMAAPKACHGQQLPDASKLAPVYRQQREGEADGRAQCYAIVVELPARIPELGKKLAEAPQRRLCTQSFSPFLPFW